MFFVSFVESSRFPLRSSASSAVSVFREAIMVKAGDPAPDFTLPSHLGGNITLSSYRGGKPVVLAFYPGDETPVCTAQLCDYRNNWAQFQQRGAEMLAISAQSIESHESFADHHKFPFALLSDPWCEVAGIYGVKMPFLNSMKRAIFIIDRDGIVRYRRVEPLPLTRRKAQELLSIIDGLECMAAASSPSSPGHTGADNSAQREK